MTKNKREQVLLRQLPGVDRMLELIEAQSSIPYTPKSLLVRTIQQVIEDLRSAILRGDEIMSEKSLSDTIILKKIQDSMEKALAPNLKPVVNATGVIIHTNLGRSLLADAAIEHMKTISGTYSNLEFDLQTGKRGSRHSVVEEILCEISGAESAMVVNNNAGAVFLCLETLSRHKKTIVSRGELVEIGGSFRIPDVMTKSGSVLKEVGTTNRTHLKDYENAIENETGLLLKVHTSNYSLVGFTAEVSLEELVALGNKYQLPVMEDLGSGTFVDFSKYGLLREPTVQEAVATGVDVVTFSGDKLLGGPQAGIILGKKELIDRIKQNPIARALRTDKLTLAALESTLGFYRDPERAVTQIPTLKMLTMDLSHIENRAAVLLNMLNDIEDARLDAHLVPGVSKAGGGSFPLLELPSQCIGIQIQGINVNGIEQFLRNNSPAIIGRIEEDTFLMDLRTINENEFTAIQTAFSHLLKRNP